MDGLLFVSPGFMEIGFPLSLDASERPYSACYLVRNHPLSCFIIVPALTVDNTLSVFFTCLYILDELREGRETKVYIR